MPSNNSAPQANNQPTESCAASELAIKVIDVVCGTSPAHVIDAADRAEAIQRSDKQRFLNYTVAFKPHSDPSKLTMYRVTRPCD